jgi:hypothetical protein
MGGEKDESKNVYRSEVPLNQVAGFSVGEAPTVVEQGYPPDTLHVGGNGNKSPHDGTRRETAGRYNDLIDG